MRRSRQHAALFLLLTFFAGLACAPTRAQGNPAARADCASASAKLYTQAAGALPYQDLPPLPEAPSAAHIVSRAFAVSDPAGIHAGARADFMTRHEILRVDTGGFGCTFVARDKSTQKIHRYKFARRQGREEEMKREAEHAALAGRIGVGPHTEFDESLGLIKMDEVEGMTLRQWQRDVMPTLPKKEAERFIENFVVTVSAHLQRLHEEGVAHLDLKPENILIPTDHAGGRNIKLIDFGVALDAEGRKKIRDESNGYPWSGTLAYQGRLAHAGKPQPADDFESLRYLIENFFPSPHPPDKNLDAATQRLRPRSVARREGGTPAFFADRPALRAMLLLLEHSVSDAPTAKDDPASPDKLLALAVQPKLPRSIEARFWELYLQEFRKRSHGQQFQILFSDPDLYRRGGLISRLSREELHALVTEGVSENDVAYQRANRVNANQQGVPHSTEEPYLVYGPAPHDIDWNRVRQIREWLGAPPLRFLGLPLPWQRRLPR